MGFLQIAFSSVLLVYLVGCSTAVSDRRIDYGAGAKQIPDLEVPPDLTAPGGDDRYKVPEGEGGTVATFSDYSRAGAGQSGQTLPEIPKARMERNGGQRWLVVRDTPENVWPVVRNFVLELGLTIKSEEKAAGVIETEWAENRAKIPPSTIGSVVGRMFGKEPSSNERDQYLVRIERGSERAHTSIYITHRGMAKAFSANKSVSEWQLRPSEPELEAIMLQRLMVRFGVNQPQAAGGAPEPGVAVPAVVAEPAGTASLRETPAGLIIAMNDPFDRAWRKIGLAIESAGLSVEDRNREKGIYFLRPVKVEKGWLTFGKSKEDTSHQYRVHVKDGGETSEASVTDQNGASSALTRQMIEAIYRHINQ